MEMQHDNIFPQSRSLRRTLNALADALVFIVWPISGQVLELTMPDAQAILFPLWNSFFQGHDNYHICQHLPRLHSLISSVPGPIASLALYYLIGAASVISKRALVFIR